MENEDSKPAVMGSAYWEVLKALILFNGVNLPNFGKMMYVYNIERTALSEEERYEEVEAFIADHDGSGEISFPDFEYAGSDEDGPKSGVLVPYIHESCERLRADAAAVRDAHGEAFARLYGEFIVTCADRTIHATGGGWLGVSETEEPAVYYRGLLDHVRLIFDLPVVEEPPSIEELCMMAEEDIRRRRLPRYGFLAVGAVTSLFGKIADMLLPDDDDGEIVS